MHSTYVYIYIYKYYTIYIYTNEPLAYITIIRIHSIRIVNLFESIMCTYSE